MTNAVTKSIEASPRKSLFTDMLTRDITLQGCILDLIDNSVNGVILASGKDVTKVFTSSESKNIFNNYQIELKYDENSFSIVDNGSGITPEHIEKYVFRFGSDSEEVSSRTTKGLSVYGVGMKRTIFKIGKYATLKTYTQQHYSHLDWDIEDWLTNDEWNLIFSLEDNTINGIGTEITISKINENIKDMLKAPTFLQNLKNKISLSYSLFIECGLKIIVNGTEISAKLPNIISDKDINYGFVKNTYKEGSRQIGEYIIFAGLTSGQQSEYFGWNVFCNGRMVLQGDKTFMTGRGSLLRQFHSSLHPFVGNIFFTSNDPTDLPWNTTKDGVDYESMFYQKALVDMAKVAKPVLLYLSSRYRSIDTILELEDDDKSLGLKNTKTVAEVLNSNEKTINFKSPIPKKGGNQKNKLEKISYQVEKEKVDKVKEVLMDRGDIDEQDINNHKVGIETFNYFFNREC